jgi:hypothetical protein
MLKFFIHIIFCLIPRPRAFVKRARVKDCKSQNYTRAGRRLARAGQINTLYYETIYSNAYVISYFLLFNKK